MSTCSLLPQHRLSSANLPLGCLAASGFSFFCHHNQVTSSPGAGAGFARSLSMIILVACICCMHPPWRAPWEGVHPFSSDPSDQPLERGCSNPFHLKHREGRRLALWHSRDLSPMSSPLPHTASCSLSCLFRFRSRSDQTRARSWLSFLLGLRLLAAPGLRMRKINTVGQVPAKKQEFRPFPAGGFTSWNELARRAPF